MKIRKTFFKRIVASALVVVLTTSVFAMPSPTTTQPLSPDEEFCQYELIARGFVDEIDVVCEIRDEWNAFVDSLSENEINEILAGGDFPAHTPELPPMTEVQALGMSDSSMIGLHFTVYDADGEYVESGSMPTSDDMIAPMSTLLPIIAAGSSMVIRPSGSEPAGWRVSNGDWFGFAYSLASSRTTRPELRNTTNGVPGRSADTGFGQNTGTHFGYSAPVSGVSGITSYSVMLHNLSSTSARVTDFRVAYHSNVNDALAWVRRHRPPNVWPTR
ncbi:MAG: hypothetical protein FWF76_02895 [Oscillospiraceae bacterium]|nr:hypothetical protein [Oscillospiraceae bacterium]